MTAYQKIEPAIKVGQQTIDRLKKENADMLARIAELEAENETLRQGEASEERWSEHYATRADELEAELHQARAVSVAQAGIIAASREEIDRLCALLGEADAKLTKPPALRDCPSTCRQCDSGVTDEPCPDVQKGGDA